MADQDYSRDIGRHDSDIITVKEDVREMKADIAFIKDYVVEDKAKKALGWTIIGAVGTIGGIIGSMFPFLADLFKAKGYN